MPDNVRVRRDWIDVRHEYLQADGRWMAGACAKPGFCRECNRDGEREPHEALRHAFTAGRPARRAALIVIAAHLHRHVDEMGDDSVLVATPFTRLRIAYNLEILRGEPISDADALAARTIGDMLALVVEPEAAG